MLRLFLLAYFSLLSGTAFAQIPPIEVMREYEKKTIQKQYYSAYEALSAFHKADSVQLLLEQAEYLLRYFSKTVGHQYFGLQDLSGSDSVLADIRLEASYQGDLHYFPVDSLLLPILYKAPADAQAERQRAKAHFLIGWYYYQVQSYFPNHWIMPEEQVSGLMYRHYQQFLSYAEAASWAQGSDYLEKAYEGIGYYELRQQNYQAAKEAFEKIEAVHQNSLSSIHPSVYYNLAFCYLKLEKPEQGIPFGQRAVEQYEMGTRKTDSYRLLALLRASAKHWEAAERNWLAWGEQNGTSTASWAELLSMYLQAEQLQAAERWADKIWTSDSIAPQTYETLISHYGSAEQLPAFISFLQNKTSTYTAQPEVLGALHFFSADAAMILSNKTQAKEYLLKAKTAFSQLYDKDKARQLETVINQVLKDL